MSKRIETTKDTKDTKGGTKENAEGVGFLLSFKPTLTAPP
jgi:hypothetical protein